MTTELPHHSPDCPAYDTKGRELDEQPCNCGRREHPNVYDRIRSLESALTAERERREGVERGRREARRLLAKAFRLSRRPAAIETLLDLMGKVGDYLNRTSDPRDILREASEPLPVEAAGKCGGKRELHGFGVPGHDCADCSGLSAKEGK